MYEFSRTAWRRWIPRIGYQHVIIMILVAGMAALILVLAGCSSSLANMPNIYLLGASYQQSSTFNSGDSSAFLNDIANLTRQARLQVRGGFFGMCVKLPTAIQNQVEWDCGSYNGLRTRYGSDVDPLNLLGFIHTFTTRIVFYGLIIGCLVLMLLAIGGLATFPGWRSSIDDDGEEREIKPFPSRPVSQLIAWALALSSGFGFISILWLHVGAVAAGQSVEINFGGFVDTSISIATMCLGWVAAGLNTISLCAIVIMILSIQLLDRLTDED